MNRGKVIPVRYVFPFLGILVCASVLTGLFFGSVSIEPAKIMEALRGTAPGSPAALIVSHRLPRILMAGFGGALLASSGLCLQNILRNPLAEPYILGISGGAAVGTITAMLLGLSVVGTNISAFCGGMIVIALVLSFSRRHDQSIILAGVMVNAFCGAIVLFLVSLADPYQMGSIMFWFMGNLATTSLQQALGYCLIIGAGLIFILLQGHRLNLLLLGHDTARTLGMSVTKTVFCLVAGISLLISLFTAVVGPLGFVGLVIPQSLRLVMGQNNKVLLPASMLCGAAFLIACDTLARSLPAEGELPCGVITALAGAPVFILLLRQEKK